MLYSLLNLLQVETHFATVNSHVMSMSRVDDFSQSSKDYTTARILALAEVKRRYYVVDYYCVIYEHLYVHAGWWSEATFSGHRASHYNSSPNVFITSMVAIVVVFVVHY